MLSHQKKHNNTTTTTITTNDAIIYTMEESFNYGLNVVIYNADHDDNYPGGIKRIRLGFIRNLQKLNSYHSQFLSYLHTIVFEVSDQQDSL